MAPGTPLGLGRLGQPRGDPCSDFSIPLCEGLRVAPATDLLLSKRGKGGLVFLLRGQTEGLVPTLLPWSFVLHDS